jgi:hypothetical protein
VPLRHDRVRAHTPAAVLRRIDDDTAARLQQHADDSPAAITDRLRALDREWDTDRTIEVEAAVTGLAGLALGLLVHPAFRLIPLVVGTALVAYGTTGTYPLLPVLRRLGVRSPREIARERYALKALRGDFDLRVAVQ